MNKAILDKLGGAIRSIRAIWPRILDHHPFIAFSTGKDSMAMTAILYEALSPTRLPCIYSHHNFEFSCNLEYVEAIKEKGFDVQIVEPFLGYFELMRRGIGFLTLRDPWCVPMLVGTGILEWLRDQGARGPREGLMFRGMTGSEFSRKFHTSLELYRRLDLPCVNPMLQFSKNEIIEIVTKRYGLPLNPIYRHMDRTYCKCCYTSDARRQAYSLKHHPAVCARYYGQIENLLFRSRLIDRSRLPDEFKTRREKLQRHGFVYWRRSRLQNEASAVKRRISSEVCVYRLRHRNLLATKHLLPLGDRWVVVGDEIRLMGVPDSVGDTVIKRMLNCLDCGFCMVECFPCRRFDRKLKKLVVAGCTGCGKCLGLRFCMGWRHRFWRRTIVSE